MLMRIQPAHHILWHPSLVNCVEVSWYFSPIFKQCRDASQQILNNNNNNSYCNFVFISWWLYYTGQRGWKLCAKRHEVISHGKIRGIYGKQFFRLRLVCGKLHLKFWYVQSVTKVFVLLQVKTFLSMKSC